MHLQHHKLVFLQMLYFFKYECSLLKHINAYINSFYILFSSVILIIGRGVSLRNLILIIPFFRLHNFIELLMLPGSWQCPL
jgi:hypothetical protein